MKNSFSLAILLIFLFTAQTNAQIDDGTIYLVDADIDHDPTNFQHRLLQITDGMTIALDNLNGAVNLNFEIVGPNGTASTIFASTYLNHSQTESSPPHAGFGDTSGNYEAWVPVLDQLIDFTAEYYSLSGGNGTLLGTDSFTLTFVQNFPDTQAPTAPTLSSTAQTDTTADLSWTGATDDTGVTGYKIFKDNNLEVTLGDVSTYQMTGLTASTTYSFAAKAIDAVGNESLASNISVTTDASAGSSGGGTVWAESSGDISYTTGNVGIGTSTIPTDYRLAVSGKIISEELKVQLQATWPDYVFKEGYDLPSLEEVQQHITEKGHLPNIPTAKEVKEHGIEVGEMNRLLLEKIEELTLYILKQHQLNARQKEINQILTKEIIAINKKLNERL
ncbi:fibronectin type III domain-containing protein [Allomuricauda sp. R78024]|uniref:fibronectin type III domain-containing protein n=1 Tax=Allomuricauda sp. R78024 TaxID=3093867 RepID=UPI0037CADD57